MADLIATRKEATQSRLAKGRGGSNERGRPPGARLSLMSSRHSSQASGWHSPGCLRQSSAVVPGGPCSGDGSGCALPGGGATVPFTAAVSAASRRAARLTLAPVRRAAAGLAAASRRIRPRAIRHADDRRADGGAVQQPTGIPRPRAAPPITSEAAWRACLRRAGGCTTGG